MTLFSSWQVWAFLAAIFAALTAIFAKVGIENINSDYATFVRTVIIMIVLAAILTGSGQWEEPQVLWGRSGLFLTLSALATGASWLCYFRALKIGDASQVAPIDKLSVVLVAVFGLMFLGEKISPSHWLGIGLIGAGAALVAWS